MGGAAGALPAPGWPRTDPVTAARGVVDDAVASWALAPPREESF